VRQTLRTRAGDLAAIAAGGLLGALIAGLIAAIAWWAYLGGTEP